MKLQWLQLLALAAALEVEAAQALTLRGRRSRQGAALVEEETNHPASLLYFSTSHVAAALAAGVANQASQRAVMELLARCVRAVQVLVARVVDWASQAESSKVPSVHFVKVKGTEVVETGQ